MIVIFDFDYTIFDTLKFTKQLKRAMGLTEQEFYTTKERACGREANYNLEKHLLFLQKKQLISKEAISGVRQLLACLERFLFPGIKQALKKIQKKHKTILITMGDKSWQKEKIRYAGLQDFFDEIIYVAKDKTAAIRKLKLKEEKAFIINDKADESLMMNKLLGNCEICLVKSPYSNNEEIGIKPHSLAYCLNQLKI